MADSFDTTRWSVVLAAARGGEGAEEALEWLCSTYWYPLYGFIRRRGHDAEASRDLTQSFFVTLLDGKALQRIDPNQGKFRAYLLARIKHFLAHETERVRTQKRRFADPAFRLDFDAAESRYLREPGSEMNPEELYESKWARTILDCALRRLEHEHDATGKSEIFRHLRGHLTGDEIPYDQLSAALGMTEGAIRVSVHRMRQRLGMLLRREVAHTVADPRDVEDEIRGLLRAAGRLH